MAGSGMPAADENADVRIQDLGPPEKIISGFNPEIYGGPLNVRV